MNKEVSHYEIWIRNTTWGVTKQVGVKAKSLWGARRARERRDQQYGASAHHIREVYTDGTYRTTI